MKGETGRNARPVGWHPAADEPAKENEMTLAIDVIASAGNLRSSGEAADVLIGYELATGMSIGDETEWGDMPLGAGTDIISFVQSYAYRDLPEGKSYGQIGRAWLEYRMAKFD